MIQAYSFHILIDRPVESVFDRLINAKNYPEWARAWSPDQQMIGQWVAGTTVSFVDPVKGGTKAFVNEVQPNKLIQSTHIAMVDPNNQELELTNEVMKTWIGTKEDYLFESMGPHQTKLTIMMVMDEMFQEMTEEGWPQALEYFKQLCEQ